MGFSLFNCITFEKNPAVKKSKTQVGAVVSCGGGCVSVKIYGWNDVVSLTSNFARVIGSGGYSNVYMGRLGGRNSIAVAVKIHPGSERFYQVFRRELDVLLRLDHNYIVKLLGYCDTSEEGALLFEHIKGGNLHEKLHSNGKETLSWRQRVTIAHQLSEAIEYLHGKNIVHGDIKSSNILLDNYRNCKLCDFGSAKMAFSSMVPPPSTDSPRSRQVMMVGSPGYTDPHYLRTGIVSKKCDVYGFGVVLLELVSGKEAFGNGGCETLARAAAPLLNDIAEGNYVGAETMGRFVDPRLRASGKYDVEEAKEILRVAALSLRQPPHLRPSAAQISQLLRRKMSSPLAEDGCNKSSVYP